MSERRWLREGGGKGNIKHALRRGLGAPKRRLNDSGPAEQKKSKVYYKDDLLALVLSEPSRCAWVGLCSQLYSSQSIV
jgi:hypothetical protein